MTNQKVKPSTLKKLPCGTETMRFGAHKGEQFYKVPLDYMEWLSKQEWVNNESIINYLKALMDKGLIPRQY